MPIQIFVPETRYAVASIPLALYPDVIGCLGGVEGFVQMTRDKEEITLILAEELWHELADRFPGAVAVERRRLIRFDTVLDFSVVGFIAEVSSAMAEADISILSLSTYRTDAILVHESRIDDAIAAAKRALATLSFTRLAQH